MSNNITTYSNISFNPLNPDTDKILIDDISHALSLMTRANGHFKEFYSVGQHSIFCAKEAIQRGHSKKVALACLLHDASEAYIADIIRPVKKSLLQYLEIEENLQEAIYSKFIKEELTDEEKNQINLIDNTMLYYEFIHYKNIELEVNHDRLYTNPEFKFVDFAEVKNEFVRLFDELN